MIVATLQQLAADLVGDPDQSRFSSKYLSCINRAQEQFSLDSKALFKDVAYSTVAGDSTLDLPTDFIMEDTVVYNGLPLKPVSRHTLYQLYPDTDWTLLEGTPTLYMVDPETANLALRLIPIPQEVKTVSMRYYPLPVEVSSGTDVVLNTSTLMTQFHQAIAAMAAWLLLTFEEQTPSIAQKRTELIKIYSDGVTKAVDMYGNTKSESLRLRPK